MQRTKEHVMEERSERVFKSTIPPEWIVRKIPSDYGIDYEIEIVENEIVTGKRFWIQLKSSENIVVKKDKYSKKYISYQIDTKLLKYALSCDFPLLLVLVDLKNETIYWLPLQDEIIFNLQLKNQNWKNQKSNTIYIPQNNNLQKENCLDGFQWYSLEPARMRAFAMIHFYYHKLQYQTRFNDYEIEDGYIDCEEELLESCKIALHYLKLTLEHNTVFGKKGINLHIIITKPLIEDGIQSCKQLREDIQTKNINLEKTGILIGKISHAIALLSTTISIYQERREIYLFQHNINTSTKNTKH